MSKISAIVLLVCSTIFAAFPVMAQEEEQNAVQESERIEMYYFHFSRRCATCLAVEKESQAALESLYPEQVENGTVSFTSVNLDEEENEALAEKLGVTGQTLLLVKGGHQEDMTSTGFMYARTKPEKLREEIGKAIENL